MLETFEREEAAGPELHQTCKGKQGYQRCAEGSAYAMNVHFGVDKVNGLIHSVEATAANVHDLTPAVDLLHGSEKVVSRGAPAARPRRREPVTQMTGAHRQHDRGLGSRSQPRLEDRGRIR